MPCAACGRRTRPAAPTGACRPRRHWGRSARAGAVRRPIFCPSKRWEWKAWRRLCLLDLAAARAAVGLDVEALAGRAALGVSYVA